MRVIVEFFRRMFAERGSGTTTRARTATMASDIERQAPKRINVDIFWAVKRAVLRFETTVCARVNRPGRRGFRQVTKAEKATRKWQDFQTRWRSYLSTPRVKAFMVEVTAYDRSSALLGHLFAWVLPICVALYVAMGLSDPGYVLAATRRALQVPPSVHTFDLTNRDNLISIAATLAVTSLLLITIKAAAAGIASILFWRSLAKQREQFPEMARTVGKLAWWQRVVLTIPPLLVVFFVTGVLHDMAVGQFTNKQAMALATLNGTAPAREALVSLITNLSWLILAVEVIAHAPGLEHARRISNWSLKLRLMQAATIRRDQRLRRSCLNALMKVDKTVTLVKDIIADTGRRLKAEVVEAGILTGAVPHDLKIVPSADVVEMVTAAGSRHLVPINETAIPDVGLDAGIPPASTRVARLFNRYAAAEVLVQRITGLERDWHDARLAGDGTYCGIETSPAITCLAGTTETQGTDEVASDQADTQDVDDLTRMRQDRTDGAGDEKTSQEAAT